MIQGNNRHIEWISTNQTRILQIYSKGLEYALVSADFKQCHPFIWCKDFLHDVVFSTLNKKPIEIYKFKFDPKKNPNPCLDKIRLMITNSKDRNFAKKIPDVLDFINQVENHLKIRKSIVRQCANPPESYKKTGVFMFEGSRRWVLAPPMLSLYSLLLRVGFSHTAGVPFKKTINDIISGDVKPYQKKDKDYLRETTLALEKILRLGDRKIFNPKIQSNYPSHLDIDLIHNRLGVVGFSTDVLHKAIGLSVIVPSWHFQK